MPVAPLAPRKRRPARDGPDLLEVHQEVRRPERRALADGRGLRRLEVRVGEGGQVAVREREVAQAAQHRDEAPLDERERLAHLDQVGVVGDVGGGRAPVDDARARPGAAAPKTRTCAITSCRVFASSRGRGLEVDVGRGAPRIWASASSGIGRPSRRSSSASQSQSRRQVSNLKRGEKTRGHLRRGVALGQRVDVGRQSSSGPASSPMLKMRDLVVAADQALASRMRPPSISKT